MGNFIRNQVFDDILGFDNNKSSSGSSSTPTTTTTTSEDTSPLSYDPSQYYMKDGVQTAFDDPSILSNTDYSGGTFSSNPGQREGFSLSVKDNFDTGQAVYTQRKIDSKNADSVNKDINLSKNRKGTMLGSKRERRRQVARDFPLGVYGNVNEEDNTPPLGVGSSIASGRKRSRYLGA